jgi:putative membrane protein
MLWLKALHIIFMVTWFAGLFYLPRLFVYHVWCGRLMLDFKHDRNGTSHVWLRWFNEVPMLVLIAAVMLVVVKPF